MSNAAIYLAIILPVLAVVVTLFLVLNSKQKMAELTSVNQRAFEKLAADLKQENDGLKAELSAIKEKVSSMEKMMNDVQ